MAAQNYTIEFENGATTSAVQLPVGVYTYVSNTVPGYENGTVESFTVTPTTTAIALRITASGELRVRVEDDLGAGVSGGSLQLSDATGDARYGAVVTISEGAAKFLNVPYTEDGIDFYLAQDASDGNHDPLDAPQAVSMSAAQQEETVFNARKLAELNMTAVDENYEGITPVTGQLVING